MAVNIEKTEFQLTAKDQASAVFKQTQGALGQLQTGYIQLSAAILGGTAFTAFVAKTIATRAAIQDLADTTGDSAKTIDGLRRVAIISGVGLDQLGGALTKLGVNLNSADDDGKAASAAIKALGLDVEQFKAMKPGEAFFEIAKAMDKFEDGNAKLAAARALLGKSGPEMLKYMKDLAEAGELNGKITDEQARAADDLEKNWRKLNAAWSQSYAALANDVIPVLSRVIVELNAATAAAGKFMGIFTWFGTNTNNPGEDLLTVNARLAALRKTRAEFAAMEDGSWLGKLKAGLNTEDKAILDKQIKYAEAQRAILMSAQDAAPDVSKGGGSGGGAKPVLPFTMPARGGGAAAAVKDNGFDSLMEGLQKQLTLQKESTELEKLLYELERKRYAEVTPQQREQLRTVAALLDVKLQERKAAEEQAKHVDAMLEVEKEREALFTRTKISMAEHVDAIRHETDLIGKNEYERERVVELMKLEKSLYDALRQVKDGDIETTARLTEEYTKHRAALEGALAAKEARAEIDKGYQEFLAQRKKETEELSEAWRTAAKDMQRGMSDFFFDAMNGEFNRFDQRVKRSIDRMVSDALAAQASIALFGKDFAKGGELGGFAAKGLNALGIGPDAWNRSNLISGTGGVAGTNLSLDSFDPVAGGGGGGGFIDSLVGGFKGLFGMASGGSFTIGGAGGTDSQLVMFRGNPGERVTVTQPGQSAGGSRMVVNNHFHISGPVDRRSQTQIAAEAGASVQRALARNG